MYINRYFRYTCMLIFPAKIQRRTTTTTLLVRSLVNNTFFKHVSHVVCDVRRRSVSQCFPAAKKNRGQDLSKDWKTSYYYRCLLFSDLPNCHYWFWGGQETFFNSSMLFFFLSFSAFFNLFNDRLFFLLHYILVLLLTKVKIIVYCSLSFKFAF